MSDAVEVHATDTVAVNGNEQAQLMEQAVAVNAKPGDYDMILDTEPGPNLGNVKGLIYRPGRRKVACVGFAETTKAETPYDNLDYEIWSLNQHYRFMPRASRWFEIHTRKQFTSDIVPGTDYIKWLRACPVPLYVTEPQPDCPTAMMFPTEAYKRLAGIWEQDPQTKEYTLRDYTQSSLVYMLALAIIEGFDTIATYGVDLVVGAEYCVAPETKVLTADLRWVHAAKVAEGDALAAFDEMPSGRGGRRWREASVRRAVRLRRPCYRITLDDGTTVVSSSEHRWLVQTDAVGWRTTEQMARSVGHRNSNIRVIRLTDVWEEDRSWDAGYLAAAFDGEGSLGPRTLGFAQRRNAMSTTVEASLAALGFRASVVEGHGASADCHTWSLRGGRPELLRFLGQVRPRRLLDRFFVNALGRLHAKARPRVIAVEFLGEQDVIGLGTSTGTFVAEGLASHNSYQKPNMEWLLGVAQGMGYTVTRGEARGVAKEIVIPRRSALLRQLYSYGPAVSTPSIMPRLLKDRIERLSGIKEQLEAQLNGCASAINESQQWLAMFDMHLRGGAVAWQFADGHTEQLEPQ